MKVYFIIYGCQMNEYDIYLVQFQFVFFGVDIVELFDEVDFVFVNICVVCGKLVDKVCLLFGDLCK